MRARGLTWLAVLGVALAGGPAALAAAPSASPAASAPARPAAAPAATAPPAATPAAATPVTANAATTTPGIAAIGAPALPPDFPNFPYVNPNAPKGGQIRLAALGNFDSLNPFILRGTPADGISRVWDSLLKPSDDEPATAYGLLADQVKLGPERMSVSFHIRPQARFADGTPVTAQDVAWTFRTLRAEGRPFYRVYYADVGKVVTDGPRRITFFFRDNHNRQLPLILGEMPVLPAHWWKGRDFTRPLTAKPLGSGPYAVESVDFGRSITLRRRADYWGRDLPVMRGFNNFDRITTEYFRDSTVAMQAFKAGQIDFRAENIAKNWATAYDFPAAREGLVKRVEIPYHLPVGMQGFAMNTRRAPFNNPLVRHALALAFDFQWMNKTLFYGAYTRTRSYFANSDLASSGLPQGAELALLAPFRADLPPDLFTQPFTLPVTDGSGNNRPQLIAALKLMRAAGWSVHQRKLENAQGQQMQFTILLSDPSYERVALPYARWLSQLGIAVSVRTVDPSQYQHLLDGFDYDMTMVVIPQSEVPGGELRDEFGCASAHTPGSQNLMGVCSPVVDGLIAKVVAATTRPELLAATHALDRVLLWSWYVVPNWYLPDYRLAYWDKFARPAASLRAGYVLDDWWVDPAAAARLAAARAGGH